MHKGSFKPSVTALIDANYHVKAKPNRSVFVNTEIAEKRQFVGLGGIAQWISAQRVLYRNCQIKTNIRLVEYFGSCLLQCPNKINTNKLQVIFRLFSYFIIKQIFVTESNQIVNGQFGRHPLVFEFYINWLWLLNTLLLNTQYMRCDREET